VREGREEQLLVEPVVELAGLRPFAGESLLVECSIRYSASASK
jgi:hypothetical protein